MLKKMYHTQERRDTVLTEPIKCIRDDAWLGEGYYFWVEKKDAEYWGDNSKRGTGWYEIYEVNVECEKILDTVFNEEHYYFWLSSIEIIAKKIIKDTHKKPTLKELNDYLKERAGWDEIAGVLFQDLPTAHNYSLIKPIKYKKRLMFFAYKKRIQMALFDLDFMRTFTLDERKECV